MYLKLDSIQNGEDDNEPKPPKGVGVEKWTNAPRGKKRRRKIRGRERDSKIWMQLNLKSGLKIKGEDEKLGEDEKFAVCTQA